MNVTGPQFLVLYVAFAFAANVWLRWHYRTREREARAGPLSLTNDPYQIALLRAGRDEAIRVAVITLLDRGLLVEEDGRLHAPRADGAELVRHPLDRALLEFFKVPTPAELALKSPGALAACNAYEKDLEKKQLLASPTIRASRFTPLVVALGFTLGVATWRIVFALSKGRSNIGFLIVLAIICAVALVIAYRKRLTALGADTLRGLERLYAGARQRLTQSVSDRDSFDASLVAAVFGLAALPAMQFPYLARVFPPPKAAPGGSNGGASCGSSCGSSCGGGGCGGGCGGCGG
ncbi:MAG: TIGR04222 domain-containing membrane protein [Betaproteobacteria bacterium]|jgi:uncharacterized protein (TIGR04222 family)|nr:TIGR04222 domain-containing membrane protein [Betaproteobacteria bacterium]